MCQLLAPVLLVCKKENQTDMSAGNHSAGNDVDMGPVQLPHRMASAAVPIELEFRCEV